MSSSPKLLHSYLYLNRVFLIPFFADFICKINEVKRREEEKPLLHEDAYRCSSAGMSDCVCSECVSVVSFQIYEENTLTCECSDCETDYANKRLGKTTK